MFHRPSAPSPRVSAVRRITGWMLVAFGILAAGVAIRALPAPAAEPESATWVFDNLENIGSHPVTVLGHPQVIDTEVGKAIAFNGVDDAIFLDVHPLAGAKEFTWEVFFRPDADGKFAQRFFHLAERNPATGADTGIRLLFEIRLTDGKWCLDSFANAGGAQALMNRQLQHPAGAWFSVAQVYDGKTYRNYVDGVLQGSAEVKLRPQGAGHTSVGVRINKVDYFKGAIRMARFTRGALTPDELLKISVPN